MPPVYSSNCCAGSSGNKRGRVYRLVYKTSAHTAAIHSRSLNPNSRRVFFFNEESSLSFQLANYGPNKRSMDGSQVHFTPVEMSIPWPVISPLTLSCVVHATERAIFKLAGSHSPIIIANPYGILEAGESTTKEFKLDFGGGVMPYPPRDHKISNIFARLSPHQVVTNIEETLARARAIGDLKAGNELRIRYVASGNEVPRGVRQHMQQGSQDRHYGHHGQHQGRRHTGDLFTFGEPLVDRQRAVSQRSLLAKNGKRKLSDSEDEEDYQDYEEKIKLLYCQ